jgi:hypothetical protein
VTEKCNEEQLKSLNKKLVSISKTKKRVVAEVVVPVFVMFVGVVFGPEDVIFFQCNLC